MIKIAIIDDDEQTRESAAILVDDLGWESFIVEGESLSKDVILELVLEAQVDAAISDHRLSPGNLCSATGAEILADLYDKKIPSLLVTQFLDIEADVGIRKYREKLPSVIGRGDQTPELIKSLLESARKEIFDGRPANREPHRAIIRVESVGNEDGCVVIDGMITTWSNDTAVRFPADKVSQEIMEYIKENQHTKLMAFVNTGGVSSQELFVTDINLAPSIEGMTLDDFS